MMTTRNLIPTLASLGVLALVGGCAGMPEQAQQHDNSEECKIVLVNTASQEISGSVADMHKQTYLQNSPIEHDYAIGRVMRAQSRDPRLRAPPSPNTLDDAKRGC